MATRKTATKRTRSKANATRTARVKKIESDSIKKAVQRKEIAKRKAETSDGPMPRMEVAPKKGREVDVEIIDLDPQFAQDLLNNTPERQRNVRKALVDRYAADMLAGRWRATGEPIQLNPKMQLINGQHRCHALIKAGVTLSSVVIEILHDDRAFEALDQQAVRSLADVVRMSGRNPAPTAVMAAIIFEYLDFKPRRLSMPERLHIVTAFPEKDLDVLRRFNTRISTAGLIAAAIRCMRSDREAAIEFFNSVFSNKPTIDGRFNDNAHLLASWALEMKSESRIGKSAEGYKRECAYRGIQAWNAWRQGRVLKKLMYKPDAPMMEAL
jgi:hypothetical protein